MSYRCVVVDDEKPARNKLKRMLAAHEDIEVVGEAADADSAVRVIDELTPDLCFLDIRMPEGDGFSVLERVERAPNVIFTTAYDEYAVRAFEVNSLDYLLKPFDRQRLAEALDRARKTISKAGEPDGRVIEMLEELRRGARGADPPAPPERITARRGSKILLLDPVDVLWFEAEETLVFARTATARVLVERTLAELEEQLQPGFFRAHRSCLVNLSQIAEIVPADAGTFRIVMRDEHGSKVPLSRRQARRLKELIPW